LILLPTYNERDNLSILIPQIFREYPNISILVIDDDSRDGTAELLKGFSMEFQGFRYIIRKGERGLGTALLRGYEEAIKSGYKYLIQMDADLQHDPKYIRDILDRLMVGCDLVIASRYVRGGGIEGWSFTRRLISRVANIYGRLVLGIDIKDLTSGFRGFNIESLGKVFNKIKYSRGYVIQVEVVYRFKEAGMKICEVPFIFRERKRGKSKLGFSTILEFFINILRLKL